MELNKVFLSGHLTQDATLRYAPNGTAVLTLRLAANHTYYKGQEKAQEVLFIDATVFGKQAESVAKYAGKKGQELLVEGRLKQNDWTDKSGQKRTTFSVVADRTQFVGGGAGKAAEGPAESAPASASQEDDLPFGLLFCAGLLGVKLLAVATASTQLLA